MANSSVPYEFIRAKFKECSPENLAVKSGTYFDTGKREFHVRLLGKKYRVEYPSGNVYVENYAEENQFVIKTLILRYLVHAQGVPPVGKEISYKDISGGQVYYPNFYGRCIQRLARMFGRDFPAFVKVMAALNGIKTGYGDISYRFQFLNNINITFILWKGDDEFPPSANILFDANVPYYFDAEDLAVVGDISLNMMGRLK